MTMITPSYLGETIEYSSLHACRSTLEDPTPDTKIVFFSIHETPTTARLVGADAFVSKASAAEDLARTINQVLGGLGTATSLGFQT